METQISSPKHLSDDELLARLKKLVLLERVTIATVVAHLAEFDARELYLSEGCSSMFTYCTQVLNYSEQAAYSRIEAARAVRRFPTVLDRLANGSLNLTGVRLLSPYLTSENHQEVLNAASRLSRREIEKQVASLRPLPPCAPIIRRLPARGAEPLERLHEPPEILQLNSPEAHVPTPPTPPLPRTTATPLSPTYYRFQVTLRAETHDRLRQAQELLRHQIPNGDPAEILDRALADVEKLSRQKFGLTARPRAAPATTTRNTRHVPASVKRIVWQRDGAQCAFRGRDGRRCTERGGLEFHHRKPYAHGGEATEDNIELRCRQHNQHEAKLVFGKQ